MRISDWSSDVCSSDLAAGFLPQERTHHGMALHALYVDGRPQDRQILSRRAAYLRKHARGRHETRPQGARVLLSGKSDLLRSEEHTSELQSLMRISYAVFCLKKNKRKIIKHKCLVDHTPQTPTRERSKKQT